MPKATSISVCPKTQQGYKFQVTVPPDLNGEKPARKFFFTRKEAQQFADDLWVRKENFGTRLIQMPEWLRRETVECAARRKSISATLSEATEYFIQHRVVAARSCTVADLVARVIETKRLAERSKRYLADLRGDFARLHREKFVSDVTAEDVESWIARRKHSPTTRNNRLRILSSAFSFTVKRRWCESNPVDRVERATERKPVARYLTAEMARTLLRRADAEMVPCIAIQLFAGLRPCEMAELKFEDTHLDKNQLWVRRDGVQFGHSKRFADHRLHAALVLFAQKRHQPGWVGTDLAVEKRLVEDSAQDLQIAVDGLGGQARGNARLLELLNVVGAY